MKSVPPDPTIRYEFSQRSDEESKIGAKRIQTDKRKPKDEWVFTKQEKEKLLEIAKEYWDNPTLVALKFNEFLKISRKNSRRVEPEISKYIFSQFLIHL